MPVTIRSFLIASFALMMTLGCASGPAQAQKTWTLLGERTVNDRAEFDTIVVGADRGRFTGLKLDVDDSPILVRRVVVHFGNGEKMTKEKNTRVGENQRSGTLDLPGGQRVITKVVFYYEASSPKFERANIKLWGRR